MSSEKTRLLDLALAYARAQGPISSARAAADLEAYVESLILAASESVKHETVVVEDDGRGFHGSCSCGWKGESVFMFDIARYDNRIHKEREERLDR